MPIPTNLAFSSSVDDHHYAIVPTTGTDLPTLSRGLWVAHNNAGSFTAVMWNDDTVVVPVHSGMAFLPLRIKRISANASSISIVALF